MSTNSAPTEDVDEALIERVRQSELRISAQASFLTAAYHRGAVLTGVLFAVVAALFGAAYGGARFSLVQRLLVTMASGLTLALVLVASSLALTAAWLPGLVYDREDKSTKATLLLELLDYYGHSFKRNERRLSLSKFVFSGAFLCMVLALGLVALTVRAEYVGETLAQEAAGDCWWELSDNDRESLREGMRPRAMIGERVDLFGPAFAPDTRINVRIVRVPEYSSGGGDLGTGIGGGNPDRAGLGNGNPIGGVTRGGTPIGGGTPIVDGTTIGRGRPGGTTGPTMQGGTTGASVRGGSAGNTINGGPVNLGRQVNGGPVVIEQQVAGGSIPMSGTVSPPGRCRIVESGGSNPADPGVTNPADPGGSTSSQPGGSSRLNHAATRR